MSASNEWTEWHLTPRGWERGSQRRDHAGGCKESDAPADRVLTYRYREFMSSVYSKCAVSSDEMWRADDEAAIAVLLKKHGDCPQSL